MEHSDHVCLYEGCKKSYSNAFNLKRHVESFHQGQKKFFCSVCHKGLSSKQNMREHSFIHQGIKPYTCTYPSCSETFRQLSQLKMHRKMHLELARYIKNEDQKHVIDLSFFSSRLSKFNLSKPLEDDFEDFKVAKLSVSENKFELEKSEEFW